MRVFLGAFGQPGHAFPMLALGERLVRRGHTVSYETWERWRPNVEAAGMEFVPAPEFQVFPSLGRHLKPYEAVVHAVPATQRQIAARAPDVVVHDILTLAPALAGELCGVPVATLVPHLYPVSAPGFPPYAIGARLPRTAAGRAFWSLFERPLDDGLRRGRDELNETRRRLGLAPVDRLHGGISTRLAIVATLPQLEYPRDWPEHVHVVGPLMWEPEADALPAGAARQPGGPAAAREAPFVLIAPSTAQDPGQSMLRAALAGLRGLDLRVLATTNRRPAGAPMRLGSNATLVSWLSYARTMPGVDLVICHAGHGTLMRALCSGVPVLAVPHSGDMGENAARLDWSGAGLRLPWRLVSPVGMRLAVQRLLDGGKGYPGKGRPSTGYAAKARELAAWCAAHDGPTRAAELIEQLAASG